MKSAKVKQGPQTVVLEKTGFYKPQGKMLFLRKESENGHKNIKIIASRYWFFFNDNGFVFFPYSAVILKFFNPRVFLIRKNMFWTKSSHHDSKRPATFLTFQIVGMCIPSLGFSNWMTLPYAEHNCLIVIRILHELIEDISTQFFKT